MISREYALKEMIDSIGNGIPKIITGIKESGKSVLLRNYFYQHLLNHVRESNVLYLDLSLETNKENQNPIILFNSVRNFVNDDRPYFLLIDNVDLIYSIKNPELTNGDIIKANEEDKDVISFVNIISALSNIKNLDIFIAVGSNINLSNEIVSYIKEYFYEIKLSPISFKEYLNSIEKDEQKALIKYIKYGGLPKTISLNKEDRIKYLNIIYENIINNIKNKYFIKKQSVFTSLLNVLNNNVGEFLNSQKIADLINLEIGIQPNKETIDKYLKYLIEENLIYTVERYDIKTQYLIGGTRKYYFTDLGIKNIVYDQIEISDKLLENVVANELKINGYELYIPTFNQVEKNKEGKSFIKPYYLDFYAEKENEVIYIQVVNNINEENKELELRPFRFVKDATRKMVIDSSSNKMSRLNNGILLDGITDYIKNLK